VKQIFRNNRLIFKDSRKRDKRDKNMKMRKQMKKKSHRLLRNSNNKFKTIKSEGKRKRIKEKTMEVSF
jgi:hypothetical protein